MTYRKNKKMSPTRNTPEVTKTAGHPKEIQTIQVPVLTSRDAKLSDPLPPIKRVGITLIIAIIVFMVIATVLIFADMVLNNPLNDPTIQQIITEISDPLDKIQTYRTFQTDNLERTVKLFTMIISSTLLPVLTAVIGYLFGSREIGKTTEVEQIETDN